MVKNQVTSEADFWYNISMKKINIFALALVLASITCFTLEADAKPEPKSKPGIKAKPTAKAKTTKEADKLSVVAQNLQSCEFLIKGNRPKSNAKVYLCLFSASWCPPCRQEMPRIAKLYQKKIKADPDLELVHISCDQSEEKARAWAKEHKVKFPVIKPKGGSPVQYLPPGIPNLVILKADGTIIESGHPAMLLTEEKLKELKKL